MEVKKTLELKVDDAYTQQRLPFLDFGKDINLQDRRGETQLHKELKAGIFRADRNKQAFETVKLLLEYGADMDICSREGTSPLQDAFLSGIPEAVEVFVPKEDQLLNTSSVTKLIKCRYLVKYFLDLGKNLNIKGSDYSPLLHFAALNGDSESFQLILDKSDANLNAYNSKAMNLLHVAIMCEKNEMVEILIDHGADPNLPIHLDPAHQNVADQIRGFTPLHLAVSKGNLEIVETLVKKGGKVNITSPYGSPLHVACDTSYFPHGKSHRVVNTKIAKFLVDNGADMEAFNIERKTPLQKACVNKYEEMVEVLLNIGASFTMKLHQRRSALHFVVGINSLRILRLFLDRGLDPNVRDLREETPLIHGWKSSPKGLSMDIVQVLLEYGADINAGDINGVTVLHIASSLNDDQNVRHLLKLGANVNASTKHKLTPLDRMLVKFPPNHVTHRHNLFKTIEILCAYIALNVSRGAINVDFDIMKEQSSVYDFYQECEKELNFLKTRKICDTSLVSYFDLLSVDIEKLTVFLRNDDVMDVLESKKYLSFPIYGFFLKDRIETGKIRRDLIARNIVFLKKVIKQQLPHFVHDMIFNNYLSMQDLRNFEKAFDSGSKNKESNSPNEKKCK